MVRRVLRYLPDLVLMTADEPHAGLALACEHVPDLTLLDINLPKLDGFQVFERLRSDPKVRHIPVVAVSANAMPGDMEKAKAAGFDGYLTKPVDIFSLRAAVRRHLQAKAASAESPELSRLSAHSSQQSVDCRLNPAIGLSLNPGRDTHDHGSHAVRIQPLRIQGGKQRAGENMNVAALGRQKSRDQPYRLKIGFMVFAKPGLADRLKRYQGGEFRFHGVLDPQGKPSFFHETCNGREPMFLRAGWCAAEKLLHAATGV